MRETVRVRVPVHSLATPHRATIVLVYQQTVKGAKWLTAKLMDIGLIGLRGQDVQKRVTGVLSSVLARVSMMTRNHVVQHVTVKG